MRLVEVVSGLGLGGAEVGLYNRLASCPPGFTTDVVALDGGIAAQVEGIQQVSDIHLLDSGASPRAVVTFIQRLRPEAVLLHSPRMVVHWARALHNAGVPAISVAHSTVLSDSRAKDLALRVPMRVANGHLKGHVAVSGRAAAGPWCAGSRQVLVAPLGSVVAPSSGANPYVWPSGTMLKILFLGRLGRPKQVAQLAKVAASLASDLRRARAHLAIVGSGPQENRVKRVLARERVDDVVSLHPATVYPGALLLEADWLIISSRDEGGPLTAYEAAIQGTGVACTPVGASDELGVSYPDMLVAKNSSRQSLEELLRAVVHFGPTTPELRAARSAVGTRWQASVLAPRFYESVARVIGGKS